MKTALTITFASIFSAIVSALLTWYFVARPANMLLLEFMDGRPADYLTFAAQIREGKPNELIKFLEWSAQMDFLINQQADSKRWEQEYSHRILDIYHRRYGIALAPPIAALPPPAKPYTDKMFLKQISSLPAPSGWPDWVEKMNTK